MKSLQESAICISALFKICIDSLPIKVTRESLSHLLNKLNLIIDVALESSLDGGSIDFELIKVDIGSVYFLVGGVTF